MTPFRNSDMTTVSWGNEHVRPDKSYVTVCPPALRGSLIRSTQTLHWYDSMSKRLAEEGINWIAVQCREYIKNLEGTFCKAKDSNRKSHLTMWSLTGSSPWPQIQST